MDNEPITNDSYNMFYPSDIPSDTRSAIRTLAVNWHRGDNLFRRVSFNYPHVSDVIP